MTGPIRLFKKMTDYSVILSWFNRNVPEEQKGPDQVADPAAKPAITIIPDRQARLIFVTQPLVYRVPHPGGHEGQVHNDRDQRKQTDLNAQKPDFAKSWQKLIT